SKLGTKYKKKNIFITSGNMNANCIVFDTIRKANTKIKKALHISPYFPPTEEQIWDSGLESRYLNFGEYRGEEFHRQLEKVLGEVEYLFMNITSPNNPTGKVFFNKDLKKMGKLSNKHKVFVNQDATYLGMVWEGKPNYDTIANHSKYYFLTISASKLCSSPGNRIGAIVAPDEVLNMESEDFLEFYPPPDRKTSPKTFGEKLKRKVMLDITSANTSGMYAFEKFFEVINRGDESYFDDQRKFYGERLRAVRGIIESLDVVEEMDYGIKKQPPATFYITMGPKKGLEMNSRDFSIALARYGVLTVPIGPPLGIFGEYKMNGVRVCVSKLDEEASLFKERMELFNRHYS
ncbi:MAG: pyridoxal phosphate-dependent aminotransferase, partial [Candidatus Aenigmarchaeota archaeon]